jgi:hypothetical protein
LVGLLLFLSQEVDNELLVLLDEVVGQSFVLKIRSKVLTPEGVERIQQSEFGRWWCTIEVRR